MKLLEYPNFEAKKKFFHHETIDSVEKFDTWIFSFESLEPVLGLKLIYRGLGEAKYKNYTSAQRDWITREWAKVLNISFIDYIDKLLMQIRKDDLLLTYFLSLGITPNDILYLSFMQHYGIPSPLLDFTKNLRTALFFAMDGMNTEPSSVEIENYFSVYAMKPTNEHAPADTLFAEGISRAVAMVDDFKLKNPDVSINDELLSNIDLLTKWKKSDRTNDGLYSIPLMYIPNPMDAAPVINVSGQKLLWSNPNIVAQKGCFIMNSNEKDTLEEVVTKNFSEPVLCIDIHKSLAEHIRSKYLDKLNQENIYPEFKKMADKAYNVFKVLGD